MPSGAGAALRATLLDRALAVPTGWAAARTAEATEHGVSPDDLLDALAAAWSAARVAAGRERLLGTADRHRSCWSDTSPAPHRAVIAV